jgi:ADP-dependent phosphofructokinase/glucokinase
MFKVEGGAINIIGECRFGGECRFAHSRIEVEKKIKDNLSEFECKHKGCKGVEIEFITKKDKDGKERKTRRYKNSSARKCFKIHEKERVTDFIMRTQGSRA